MIEWKSVYSDTVDQIGHDPETNELHVLWQKGKHSIYSDVDATKAAHVMNSWSVGHALHAQIKPQHGHRYGD